MTTQMQDNLIITGVGILAIGGLIYFMNEKGLFDNNSLQSGGGIGGGGSSGNETGNNDKKSVAETGNVNVDGTITLPNGTKQTPDNPYGGQGYIIGANETYVSPAMLQFQNATLSKSLASDISLSTTSNVSAVVDSSGLNAQFYVPVEDISYHGSNTGRTRQDNISKVNTPLVSSPVSSTPINKVVNTTTIQSPNTTIYQSINPVGSLPATIQPANNSLFGRIESIRQNILSRVKTLI